MYDETEYRPKYIVKYYQGTRLYRVIRFKIGGMAYGIINRDLHDDTSSGEKLQNNLIRARTMVFQYAMCNPWEWFATITLDRTKYNRYDLDKYREDVSQFIRNLRKKYNTNITYLIIPEQHKDGAWHMHGLFGGIPESAITEFNAGKSKTLQKLKRLGYMNWSDYANKFGFVSMGRVKDAVSVAFYVTKYITKDMQSRVSEYGKHLYYTSQKLNKAENVAIYYDDEPYLDNYCTFDTEFCSLGMVYADESDKPYHKVISEPDFWLPDRDHNNNESVEFADTIDNFSYGGKPTTDETEKIWRKMDMKRERENAQRELGYDVFEHVTYKQLDILNM